MSVTQKTVVLNEFGGASLQRRERTTSTGTSVRYTVSIEAQPFVHVFDAKTLGAGPAHAIVDHLRRRVEDIGMPAAPATILRRKYAKSALERGARWATERYGGGKMGTMAPTESDRLFNDSGRLAKGLVASPTRDNNWVINVPANRFDPSTFRDGEAGLVRMYTRLRELVPEFGDANQLGTVPAVRQAIGESIDFILMRGLGRTYGDAAGLRERVRAAQLDAIREALALAQQAGLV